jgi:hypothetical protein
MTLRPALATLLLILSTTTVTTAHVPDGPIPGTIANVTIALALSYPESPTVKVLTNTSTAYKEIETVSVTKKKYGNKEFISQLIANDILPASSAATDWQLKYVTRQETGTGGVFAVKKDGTSVYLGGIYADDEEDGAFPINLVPTQGSAFATTTTYTEKRQNFDPFEVTEKRVVKGTQAYSLTLRPADETHANLTGLLTVSGITESNFIVATETEANSQKVTTYALTQLVGNTNIASGNGDAVISGSFTLSGFKNVADVSSFFSTVP